MFKITDNYGSYSLDNRRLPLPENVLETATAFPVSIQYRLLAVGAGTAVHPPLRMAQCGDSGVPLCGGSHPALSGEASRL